MCISPAKIEVEFKTIEEAPKELLGNVDPCKIPEKELNRELKRCKNCLSFSGSNVAMQVQCGTKSRLIRSDILDRDMFDKNAKTPSHTSWTIALLQKMDSAVGPGVIDRQRMFSIEETYEPLLRGADSEVLQEVSGGKYDSLFPGARNKPSAVYRASKILPPIPAVQLVSSEPFQPENVVLPVYPSLAKLARVEGVLSFSFVIDAGARPADVVFESGNPLLRAGVAEAVGQWKFPNASAGQRIESKIEFLHNCPIQQPILTP
jgi:hypothetical protein